MTEGAQLTPTPEQPAARRRRAALGWWVLAVFGLLAVLALVLGQLFHTPAQGQASAGTPTTPPTTSHAGGQTPSFSGTTSPSATATGAGPAGTGSAGTGTVGSGGSVGTGSSTTPAGGAGASNGSSAPGTTTPTTTTPGTTTPGSGTPFTITVTGTDGPLVPGARRTLTVRVHNPNASTIRLLSLTASVGDPQRPGCSASWVTVGGYAAAQDPLLLVASGRSTPLSLPIVLTNLATVNQDACKGADFPLSFNGSAAQVTP